MTADLISYLEGADKKFTLFPRLTDTLVYFFNVLSWLIITGSSSWKKNNTNKKKPLNKQVKDITVFAIFFEQAAFEVWFKNSQCVDVTSGGRTFQRPGEERLKAVDPMVVMRAGRIVRLMEDVDLKERQLGMFKWRDWVTYGGLRLWRALNEAVEKQGWCDEQVSWWVIYWEVHF